MHINPSRYSQSWLLITQTIVTDSCAGSETSYSLYHQGELRRWGHKGYYIMTVIFTLCTSNNQCLSPPMMPVLFLPIISYTQFSFIGQSLSVTNGRQAGQRLSPGIPFSSTINTNLSYTIETS